MVLLIWSTLLFAASVVTYSWFGLNEDLLTAQGSDGPTTLKDARFNNVVGWVASGALILLVCVVLLSFFYFWRVSSFASISSVNDKLNGSDLRLGSLQASVLSSNENGSRRRGGASSFSKHTHGIPRALIYKLFW